MEQAPVEAPKQGLVARTLGMLAGIVVVVGVVAVFGAADGQMFEDAAFTRLYAFTLQQAYSRFDASDRQVPAQPAGSAADPMQGVMAQGPGQSRASQPGQAQRAASAQAMQRLQQFGNQQQSPITLPGGAGQGSGRAQPRIPDDGGPHTIKGNEHLRKREYDQAIKEYQLALQENPARTLTQHSLGDALRYLQRDDEAIAAYRKVLQLNPEYYCCYTHIGDIERSRNNTAAANQAYNAAIAGYQKQVGQGGSVASAARYHLAKLYYDTDRNVSEALALAEQALQDAPDSLAHLQLLAQIYEKVGRTSDAAAMYDRLMQVSPQHAPYFQQQKDRLSGAATPPAPPKP
jgi:tetratricopeptide (TPR) repeat protein